MTRHSLLRAASIAALALSLAACQKKAPQVFEAHGVDPMKAELAKAPPVELPPAMKGSKTFRCKDNSVVYVDFFVGDKQANVHTTKDGAPTMLKADEAGKPMTAEGGWSMTGTGSAITLAQPGKPAQSCKA